MPNIYISPSTQEYNPYITGSGSEEYWMNQIADAMEPYLRANTIRFTRNTPDMTAASSIAQAARGSYDFYLALHSNASGDGSTTALGEVRQPKPPSVLLEIGYHDNTADAVWIQDNVQNIAENLSRSLAEYFALPFIYPMTPRTGTVVTERDALNVRAYPAMSGQVVGSVPHEAQLTVYGQTDGWYSMGYGNLAGYVRSEYVRL